MTALFAWTPVASTPFDYPNGPAQCAVWAKSLGLWVLGGYTEDGSVAIATSPDAVTWTPRGNPWGSGGCNGLAWSEPLGLLVAVGGPDGGSTAGIFTSPDGITWTSRGNPSTITPSAGSYVCATGVAWSDDLAEFCAVGPTFGPDAPGGVSTAIVTSPDGATWTNQATALDASGYNGNALIQVAFDTIDGVWIAVGVFIVAAANGQIVTSPDGATWTIQTNPYSPYSVPLVSVCGTPEGHFSYDAAAIGGNTGEAIPAIVAAEDSATWISTANAYLDTAHGVYTAGGIGVCDAAIALIAVGGDQITSSATGDAGDWNLEATAWEGGEAYGAAYSPDLAQVLAFGQGGVDDPGALITGIPVVPPGSAPFFHHHYSGV